MKKKVPSKRPAARKAARPRKKPIQRRVRKTGPRARRPTARGTARPAASAASALKSRFLEKYRRELATTLRVLRAFPAGTDDFKPHENSRTVARVAHTFAVENTGVLRVTRGEKLDPATLPPPVATLAEAVGAYERSAAEVIAAVEAMPDSRLSETVTFFTGPGQMGEVPVLDVLWFMLMDSIHHRGQLSVYLRMAGGKVPSIYGPSADEPWR